MNSPKKQLLLFIATFSCTNRKLQTSRQSHFFLSDNSNKIFVLLQNLPS